MLKDLHFRAKLKRYLIWLNIALGILLLSLIVYWLASVRPNQIKQAIQLSQYRFYTIDNLPDGDNEINPDYIGLQKNIADATEDINQVDAELESIDSEPPESDFSDTSKLIADTNKLLEKSNQVLTTKNSIAATTNPKQEKQYKGKPRISIIVTNLGLNRRSTELALTLPKECALGFLPYTKSLKPLLNKAQGNGHEIYLYLPLQTSASHDNPGRYALMNNLAQEENALRLNVILNSQARYNGVYSSYKEVFTDNANSAEMLFDYLGDKNLIFILGKGHKLSNAKYVKSHNNILPTNIILDEEIDAESISANLNKLIRIAEEEGIALGYAQGFTLTIEIIRKWAPSLKHKGVELVPVSELLKEYNS